MNISNPNNLTRRSVLATLGIGLAAAGSGYAIDTAPVIEWNAHLFSSDVQRYPIHPKATYQRDMTKEPADPLAVYLKRLDSEKIDRAVVVHPEPYGDDHALILEALRREPKRLRGTSLFYPNDPSAASKLKALVQREPRIIATRFHAHRGKETYLKSFADTGVRAIWKQAADLGLVIELHIGPDYAAQAGAAIRAFPGCKVLIDHLAEPHLGSAVEFADVLDLAQLPNVYMKLSGLGHFAKDEPFYESALPFTSRVVREFGPDKIVWGSGSPMIVDKHLINFSVADRAKVKGGNVRKLLNWN
ncbi:MAG: amidohydrolase family protein [Runella sp.]